MIVDDSDIGKYVLYYLEGWRCGKLALIKGKNAVIEPIAAKGGKQPRDETVEILETMKDGQRVECVKKIEKTEPKKETKNEVSEEVSQVSEETHKETRRKAGKKVSKGEACCPN